MGTTKSRRLGVMVSIGAMWGALAVPAFAANEFTVGDFVQRLAQSRGLVSTDARIAGDALRGIGVRLPDDLSFANPLTEGDATRIARAAGFNVRTSNPSAIFGAEQVELFFVSFGDEADGSVSSQGHTNPGNGSGPGNGNGGPPFDPYTKGKHGKGKAKHHPTPTDPE